MAEVDRALSRLRTAARKLAVSTERQKSDQSARDAALKEAHAAGAKWDALEEAAGVSRPTIAKALKRE